ncbi:MAG: alpha/beta hydrolase [Acidobacteriia bacterium]|nr:alpha/beta hydrolase [Terriglobia bacterium]
MIRLLSRCALAVVTLATVLACAGATYQLIGTWRDARRFPQRGKSVQVGQIKLNLDCYGQGYPTVILDSGMGVPALGWIRVQPEVAKFARVCSYDRAGYGWSEPGPEPRTSLQIATELNALLDAAGERRPYILVGHSFGGYNVRVFTRQYPNDVLGIVLVDASHEDEEERIDSLLPAAIRERERRDEERNEKLDRILAPLRLHLGIERLEVAAGWDVPGYRSKDLQEEFLYLEQQTKSMHAVESEASAEGQSSAQARAAGNFGDRPLIILTAGKPYDPDSLLTKEDLDRQNDMWINVLQMEETHLSSRGKQIVVRDSGHIIPSERPDTVISAIHEVWMAVR